MNRLDECVYAIEKAMTVGRLAIDTQTSDQYFIFLILVITEILPDATDKMNQCNLNDLGEQLQKVL